MRNTGISFDAIFITGDLRFAPRKIQEEHDKNAVVNYIRDIAESAGITDMKNIYMVPGNHDVTNNKLRQHAIIGSHPMSISQLILY